MTFFARISMAVLLGVIISASQGTEAKTSIKKKKPLMLHCVKTVNIATNEVKLRYMEPDKAAKHVEKYTDSGRRRTVIVSNPDLCARAGITPKSSKDHGNICVNIISKNKDNSEYSFYSKKDTRKLLETSSRNDNTHVSFPVDTSLCNHSAKKSNTPAAKLKPGADNY